jgi:hypothetical protein
MEQAEKTAENGSWPCLIAQYTKLPVTVDAIQWDGDQQRATKIIYWIAGNNGAAHFVERDQLGDRCIIIYTLEGSIRAMPGDWIIRGVRGEFYPCKPDIFEVTYDPVEDES